MLDRTSWASRWASGLMTVPMLLGTHVRTKVKALTPTSLILSDFRAEMGLEDEAGLPNQYSRNAQALGRL